MAWDTINQGLLSQQTQLFPFLGKKKKASKPKFTLQLKGFSTEKKCIKHFEKLRWKGKIPISPFDPTSKVYKCANNRYRCKNTGKYFNVKTGTIFGNSNISLQQWFVALYLFSSDKKGFSSHQLAKFIKTAQKSAWYVLQRLRRSFECPIFKTMLENFVEMDEAYVGGSNSNRHWDKKVPNSQGRSWKDKTPIWRAIERGGNLIAQVVPNVEKNTLEPIVRANIEVGSTVYTDAWKAYKGLGKWFNHQKVNHGAKQYVNGKASTNAMENFWSHFKRGIDGTYHWVSKKHLQSYVDEFTLRFNTRKYKERERFDLVLLSSIGKSLTYRELTAP